MINALPSPLITRLAPTPSGSIHLGNAFNFILTAALCKIGKGRLHLRIDDFDQARTRECSVEDILWCLSQLGIEFDSGPSSVEQWRHSYQQQQYVDFYFEEIIKLSGPQAFSCHCSRAQIMNAHPQGHYLGTCRGRTVDLQQRTAGWRLKVDRSHSASLVDLVLGTIQYPWDGISGDIQLRRGDGIIAAHPLSVLEDRRLGINFIVRGMDLLESSLIQETLRQEWSLAPSPVYVHHGNLTKDQQKLSKTWQASALSKMLNERGKKWVFQTLATLCGLAEGKPAQLEEWTDALASRPSLTFLSRNIDLSQIS